MESKKPVLPPVYFVLAMLGMIGLNWAFPLVRWMGQPGSMLGAVLILLGVVVEMVADGQFKRYKTTVKPFQSATALVKGGIFRFTRNPMYLGMVVILLGIGLVLGSLTPLIIIPIFAWLMQKKFIVPEELSLEQQFGRVYTDYKKNVRRWI